MTNIPFERQRLIESLANELLIPDPFRYVILRFVERQHFDPLHPIFRVYHDHDGLR